MWLTKIGLFIESKTSFYIVEHTPKPIKKINIIVLPIVMSTADKTLFSFLLITPTTINIIASTITKTRKFTNSFMTN